MAKRIQVSDRIFEKWREKMAVSKGIEPSDEEVRRAMKSSIESWVV